MLFLDAEAGRGGRVTAAFVFFGGDAGGGFEVRDREGGAVRGEGEGGCVEFAFVGVGRGVDLGDAGEGGGG